jgi:SpoVK/Ycf46/Vps4 family AAA+-type ATPase
MQADSDHILERQMRRIFRVAEKWNAVILIDEADVLMSKRSENTLEKNSIVSGE